MKDKGVELPAPGSAAAPKYWEHQGGELAPAMHRLIKHEPLSGDDMALIRAYFRQWIGSPVWDLNPNADGAARGTLMMLRQSVDGLTTAERIHLWLRMADAEGVNPL